MGRHYSRTTPKAFSRATERLAEASPGIRARLRISVNGTPTSSWEIADAAVRDASGNEDFFPPQNNELSNGWPIMHIIRPMDPGYPW